MHNCIAEVMVYFVCCYCVFGRCCAAKFCTLFSADQLRKKIKVQLFCCAAPSKCTIETNEIYHELYDEILHWLTWFTVKFVWKMKRKEHFPHLLPLKEGGEDFNFLVVGCTNTNMKWMNQCIIPLRRWWYISYILIVMLESAAQQRFCTLFFRIFF